MEVELWLDVSCPWCAGALPVMKKLLEELEGDGSELSPNIQWRFQRLYDMPDDGMKMADLWSKYGMDADAIHAANDEVSTYNTDRGVQITHPEYLFNPRLAHALLCLARDSAEVDMWRLAPAVWAAYWQHTKDISRVEDLRAGVELGGVELPERIWDMLSDGEGGELVDADHERALAIKLDGVPRFYVNDTIVPAWLDVDEVRARLRTAVSAD